MKIHSASIFEVVKALKRNLIKKLSKDMPPVTPNASLEAKELLQFLYSISGKQTLTGQHCNPLAGSTRLPGIHKLTGHYPAVFGQDFGFSAAGTWDGINFRQQIVDKAIRRHEEGFIITLMWHAVRPIDEEPVIFEQSIEGSLTAKEWEELVTPGSEINERWKSQVDVIAWFLKQLREAAVPVLWRPYHEMNGDWFWWGKKTGEFGYKKLYQMLFERLANFHGLNNLLWVFNANEVRENVDPYELYFPGADIVDILATDVYRGGFAGRIMKICRRWPAANPSRWGRWAGCHRPIFCTTNPAGHGSCCGETHPLYGWKEKQ